MKAKRNLAHKLEMTCDDLAFNVSCTYTCFPIVELLFRSPWHAITDFRFHLNLFSLSLSLARSPFMPQLYSYKYVSDANALKYVTHTHSQWQIEHFSHTSSSSPPFLSLSVCFLMNMNIHPSIHPITFTWKRRRMRREKVHRASSFYYFHSIIQYFPFK